jgi:hypothetical protein
MSEYNATEAAVTKPEVAASKKKKPAGRTVKLKSSKWYQSAVRSIGITKESLVESRDGVFK